MTGHVDTRYELNVNPDLSLKGTHLSMTLSKSACKLELASEEALLPA